MQSPPPGNRKGGRKNSKKQDRQRDGIGIFGRRRPFSAQFLQKKQGQRDTHLRNK